LKLRVDDDVVVNQWSEKRMARICDANLVVLVLGRSFLLVDRLATMTTTNININIITWGNSDFTRTVKKDTHTNFLTDLVASPLHPSAVLK